jgi:hypothetical protein
MLARSKMNWSYLALYSQDAESGQRTILPRNTRVPVF